MDYLKFFAKQYQGNTARIISKILQTRVMVRILTITTSIIIARNLGAEGKGILAAVLIIPSFFSTLGHLGLPISNIYFIGKKKDKETLFINSICFVIIGSFLYILAATIALPVFKKSYFSGISSLNIVYLAIIYIAILLASNFVRSFIRGLEKYKEYNYFELIQRVLKLVLVITFFFFFGLSVEIVLILTVASSVLTLLYGYTIVRKEIALIWKKVNYSQFRMNLSYALREQLGYLFAYLNVDFDMMVLVIFLDSQSIGIYSVVIGILALFQMIPNSIGIVLLPKISKTTTEKARNIIRKSIFASMAIQAVGFLIFVLVAKWFIQVLYGPEFLGVYYLAVVMILGQIMFSICAIINKFFSGIGRPGIKSIIRAINIPIKMVALLYLANQHGVKGAAWAYVIGSASLLLLTSYFYFKVKNPLPSHGTLGTEL